MPPVWFERVSAVYKENLKVKDQEDHQEIRLRLPSERSPGTHGKDCEGLIGRQHELLTQRLLNLIVTRFKPPRLQLVDAH